MPMACTHIISIFLLCAFNLEMISCVECDAGTYNNSMTECTVCQQGLYKQSTGPGVCIACEHGKHASPGLGASTCVSCSGLQSCQCAAGYGLYGNSTFYECRECEAGSYSTKYGKLHCVECSPGYHQTLKGQQECNICKGIEISVEGAVDCYKACDAGSYLTGTGCVSCPSNSHSVAESIHIGACTCNEGYNGLIEEDDGSCNTCSAGYYKSNTEYGGITRCEPCGGNTTSVSGSHRCFTSCNVGSYLTTDGCKTCRNTTDYNTSSSEPFDWTGDRPGSTCFCDSGYTGGEGGVVCTPCATGSFKDTNGGAKCTACPDGFNDSPVASRSVDGCTCKAGTFLEDDGVCTDCPAGTFKETSGLQACTQCGVGYISTNASGSTACTKCGERYGTVMQYTPCITCNNTNSTCVSGCVHGTDSATSRTSCRLCTDEESFDNETASCICTADHYRPHRKDTNSNECIPCPEATFKFKGGDQQCTPCGQFSRRSVNQSSSSPCSCAPGAFEDIGGCALCALGTYKNTIGSHACSTCNPGQSTLQVGSTDTGDCKCAAGSYSSDVGTCQSCPAGTFSANVGDGDISQCRICGYKEFQPLAGATECLPMFVSLLEAFESSSRVVGLFVEGATSCAFVSRDSTETTDKVCWGEETEKNPKMTRKVMSNINDICGNGILHPILEQCDDGNFANSDGCSTTCKIEHDFFCEARTNTANISESLNQISECCRISGNPPSHTPKCARCSDRIAPYPGVYFNVRDCGLEDVDECAEGTDGCVLQGRGVVCSNRDARDTNRVRFECECPPGFWMSDVGCSPERFATRVVFDVDTTARDIDRLTLYVREEAYDATGVVVGEVVVDWIVTGLQFTMFVGSWDAMQLLTAGFNTTRVNGRSLQKSAEG